VVEGVVLETERLRLRAHVAADVDSLQAVLGDPVAMEFYPAAFDRRGVEEWIRKNHERYVHHGYGKWAMVMKTTGELCGSCGLVLQEVEGRSQIEVGYNVRRDLWGRGYATEAARASIEYAFGKLGADRVIAMIRPENLRSVRVAEKNGMICEKVIFWRGYDHGIYVKVRAS
jgi:[ribosomal protein S5]-alanine N-acetyltransferase